MPAAAIARFVNKNRRREPGSSPTIVLVASDWIRR
jgi:hypothetical protein